jgi:hypothetical protein
MLVREMIDVYFENHTKHVNTLRGQNAEMLIVKSGDAYTPILTTLRYRVN